MTDVAVAVPVGGAVEGVRPGWATRFVHQRNAIAGVALTGTVMAVAALAGVFAPGDPFASVAAPFLPPSGAHPMGTDDLGRDLLDAVVHGARTSMVVVLAVVAGSTLIGSLVGLAAGYRGGAADEVLMRVTDMFQAVPRFFLAILAVALLGPGTGNLILILALTSWPQLARVVRAETKTLRARSFVDAARALGATDRRILAHHLVPHLLPSMMVIVSLTAGRVILLEASLGFLGLGDPNAMSWGYLANNAQRFLRTAWWMSFFPGVAIVVAVFGFALVSDAVTDVNDPTAAARRDRTARAGRRAGVRAALVVVPVCVLALVLVVAAIGVRHDAPGRQPPGRDPRPAAAGPGVALGDLKRGDCFDQPAEGADRVVTIPCTEPHTDEVFAVLTFPGGPDAPYPAQIDDEADGRCYDEFVPFVGEDLERSALTYDWYAPSSAAWGDGERRVPCVVADPEGEPLVGRS